MAGQFTNADVPKKALVAQDIIYQASTLLSIMDQAGIPTEQVVDQDIKMEITAGNPGHYDVGFDADTEPSKLAYTEIQARIKWAHRPFMILDGSKLSSRVPGRMQADSLRAVAGYFAAVRNYEAITSMLAAAGSTTAAGATWDNDAATIETDIITALTNIDKDSNAGSNERISVIIPAGVKKEIEKLTMIENIQQTMKKHMSSSFNLDFFAFRPYKYKKTPTASAVTEVLDGLTTNALVFVQGGATALQLQFNPAAASSLGAPMTERGREIGRGDIYTQKMGIACMPIWDELATYTSKTSYATHRIQKITGVSL